MPSLSGFSNNPLVTRNDLLRFANSLLLPLHPYFSPAKARIQLPVSTGAHFDPGAAQLEGFARPLWAVAAILASLSDSPTDTNTKSIILQPWIQGLAAGTDPTHPEYWGDIQPMDQRMVEAEIVSYALLQAPRAFWDPLSERHKVNVVSWLKGMNGKAMPPTNWLWFRVMANVALVLVCGVPLIELKQSIDTDLDTMEEFVRDGGWSSDGYWLSEEQAKKDDEFFDTEGIVRPNSTGRQCDYYSGSFAIQFSQLLYSKFARDIDPERAAKYQERARQFGADFWKYFDSDGACIPFGRSLTYRFACGAFFASIAVAGVPDMPHPLQSQGAVKGFLLRHLRWWVKNSNDIFHQDGTLNIGWLFPNMYMSEDYNSPQSVYWCMKSLIVLSLSEEDSFWKAEEIPYPETPIPGSLVVASRQIICNHPKGNHHFLLSAGQWVGWPMKATQAKYCKFAYSSAFGFSVPTGPLLQQLAPDNTLAFSRDGKLSWIAKWKCGEVYDSTVNVQVGEKTEEVTAVTVQWYPWPDKSINVVTQLVPPMDETPDWHFRIHTIRINAQIKRLCIVEGGFAISRPQTTEGRDLKPVDMPNFPQNIDIAGKEGNLVFPGDGCIAVSKDGASGIALMADRTRLDPNARVEYMNLQSDANTNLMCQRTIIPLVSIEMPKDLEPSTEFVIATKVLAISTKANGCRAEVTKNMSEQS